MGLVGVALIGAWYAGAFTTAAKATTSQTTAGIFTETTIAGPVGDLSDLQLFKAAITNNESGGNYRAVSPPNPKVGNQRAYGKYQVLAGNIGPWTQEATGRRYSIQEFLDSPQVQEQVFDAQVQKLFVKYGSWDDVAASWFSGAPYAGNNRCDINICVPEYVARIRGYMNKHRVNRVVAFPNGHRFSDEEALALPGNGEMAKAALKEHCARYGCPFGGINNEGVEYPRTLSNGQKVVYRAELHTNGGPHTGMSTFAP